MLPTLGGDFVPFEGPAGPRPGGLAGRTKGIAVHARKKMVVWARMAGVWWSLFKFTQAPNAAYALHH